EQAGVGARVLDYRPDLGVLLLGYLDGKTLENNDFQRDGVIAKAARACRALHDGPRFRGRFDMFERQPAYLQTTLDHGFRIPADY
ncbi:LPS biosynthesis choline kinase, partial [Mycobacterium sp. ITM-2017-0098]